MPLQDTLLEVLLTQTTLKETVSQFFGESCLKTVQGSLGRWFNCGEGVMLVCQVRAKEMANSPEDRDMEPKPRTDNKAPARALPNWHCQTHAQISKLMYDCMWDSQPMKYIILIFKNVLIFRNNANLCLQSAF